MENQHENSNEKNVSLIKKIYAKLHGAKISQKLVSLIVTGATILTLNSCTITITPDKNNNETNNGENNNNQNNSQNNNQNNNNNQEDLFTQTKVNINLDDCSQFLKNILTNPTYDSLVSQVYAGNHNILNRGEFKPHPYTFLENEGFDIQSIMNGETETYTMSYILDEEPNSLYIQTSISENNYYCHYLLKYNLTNTEMKDYKLLHEGKNNAKYFIQAMFANNEISKLKNCEIVAESKILKTTQEIMKETMNCNDHFPNTHYEVIFLSLNNNDYTYSTLLYPPYQDRQSMKLKKDIHYVTCSLVVYPDVFNSVYYSPGNVGSSALISSKETKNATLYLSQETDLTYTFCDYLEDN